MNVKKGLILIFLFCLVVPSLISIAATYESKGGDFKGFLIAGERFIEGTFLYEGSRVATNVTWPPFFAVAMAPFSLLAKVNRQLTFILWYLLNCVLFIFCLGAWTKLLFGKPCGWLSGKKELSLYSPLLLVPLVLVAVPLLKNAEALQLSVVLLFFMTLGIEALGGKRPVRAGIWFGVAAAIKAFPVLIMVFLLHRRYFKAGAAMVLTGVVLTALPLLRYGYDGYVSLMQSWLAISLSGGYPLGGWNQSVYAMIGRYVASNPFELMIVKCPTPATDAWGSIAATWMFRSLFVICICGLWWLLHKRHYHNIALEAAVYIAVMTIFSPIAWRHYFVLLFPAWMIITFWWQGKRDTVLGWVLVCSGVLIPALFLIGLAGKPVRGFFLCVLSHFTLGAFVALGGLLYCVLRGYGNEIPAPAETRT